MTHEAEKRLIDAVNLICDYVSENIPLGYEIQLTTGKNDAYVELYDLDTGGKIECDSEIGYSQISLMCKVAKELENGQ